MRTLSMVLLLSLALCYFLDAARAEDQAQDANCDKYIVKCPRNSAPVCGTDGVTYGNECMLCLEMEEKGIKIQIKKYGKC
ncbi:serine protease inhibitor Kazal-type 1-like [Dromiciops gliroides]|uniref:serine protease inhibitor Kazal-type 1-like n=1 Tax=Dromiciops gliroides TaxID=33562 RepID=UPI001CC82305|nr:serine protease inhibitor Kazal-type 1-like [Dromiciops gliroides]